MFRTPSFRILLLLLGLILALPLQSAKRKSTLGPREDPKGSYTYWLTDRNSNSAISHHLWGFYTDAAFTNMFHTMPTITSTRGGYALGIGPCYEYQKGAFRLQVGLGIRFQDIRLHAGDTTFYDPTVTDALGQPYTLKYDFRNRVDGLRNVYAQLPLLLGGSIRSFVIQAGFKPSLAVLGRSHISLSGSTSGIYPQFDGVLEEMDNHGFRKDVPIAYTSSGALQWKFDWLASLELGYEYKGDYTHSHSTVTHHDAEHRGILAEYRIRVTAFVDYGLLSICPGTHKPLVTIPQGYKWDFGMFEFNPTITTTQARNAQLHNFYAGLKITVFTGHYMRRRCMTCQPEYVPF